MPYISKIIGALLLSFAAADPAAACRVSMDFKVPTADELLANADLIVSGSIQHLTPTNHGKFVARIKAEKWLKGMHLGDHGFDCGIRTLPPITSGEWWTVLLKRDGDRLSIIDLRTYCQNGAAEAVGSPRGHCTTVLNRDVHIGEFEIMRGSTAVMGPNREPHKLYSARTAPGSTYFGFALPPGTVVAPLSHRILFHKPTRLGPLTVEGNVSIYTKSKSVIAISAAASGGNSQESPGQLKLEGAAMTSVSLAMPGMVPIEASPLKGVKFRGFLVQDYVYFSPAGEITDFRSAAKQNVQGITAVECDNVRLHEGKPFDYPFYNPCKGARTPLN